MGGGGLARHRLGGRRPPPPHPHPCSWSGVRRRLGVLGAPHRPAQLRHRLVRLPHERLRRVGGYRLHLMCCFVFPRLFYHFLSHVFMFTLFFPCAPFLPVPVPLPTCSLLPLALGVIGQQVEADRRSQHIFLFSSPFPWKAQFLSAVHCHRE